MTKTWVWWWFLYLRENEHYKAYCEARRAGDQERCHKLEAEYVKLCELYDDWGDIHLDRPKTINDAGWQAWVRERHALFFAQHAVRPVLDVSSYVAQTGHLLLDIPLAKSKASVLKQLDVFLSAYYTATAVVPPTPPKYALHAPHGRIDGTMLERAQKAYYIHMHRRLHKAGRPLSIADTALEIAKSNDKRLGWSLDAEDKDDLARGRFKKVLLDSEVTQIKRYRKDYDAYVRNTIHGRFPDNR